MLTHLPTDVDMVPDYGTEEEREGEMTTMKGRKEVLGGINAYPVQRPEKWSV